MKTKYKYIHFICVKDTGKTTQWEIRNNQTKFLLGGVKWFSSWRQYCFFTVAEAVFNNSCMLDILDFIGQLEEARKAPEEPTCYYLGDCPVREAGKCGAIDRKDYLECNGSKKPIMVGDA